MSKSEYFPQFLEMTSYISLFIVMGPLVAPRARGRLGADSIELGWGFAKKKKKKKAVLANPWGVSMTHFPPNLELFLRSPSGKFPCGLPKSLNICWGMGGFLSFRNELSVAGSRLQDLRLVNPKRLTTPAQREPTITTHKYIPANI